MQTKKVLCLLSALILLAALVFVFVGCGKSPQDKAKTIVSRYESQISDCLDLSQTIPEGKQGGLSEQDKCLHEQARLIRLDMRAAQLKEDAFDNAWNELLEKLKEDKEI